MAENFTQKLIGTNIRKAREEGGLTQVELGEKIHLSRVSINELENGHRRQISYNTIKKIAEALNKPEKYFFIGETDTPPLIPELKFLLQNMSKLPLEKQELLIPIINSIMSIVLVEQN
jgi:transcriptional regulator with XRE-family HTH domain